MFHPLVRIMVSRGLRFPDLSDALKELYVDACERHFQLGDKRLTDSRISLLTGLQRKDVRDIRARLAKAGPETDREGAGPLARVVARWLADTAYRSAAGAPCPLRRAAKDNGPSFERLVADVSRDVHPRTVLDELKRQDLVDHDGESDMVSLRTDAYLPSRDETALLGYFGANLGDHAEAAAANLEAAPEPGPCFERAVHYNELTPDALAELNALAGRLQSDVLAKLNAEALALQQRDAGADTATGRFRCGAFVYTLQRETRETEE